MYRALIVDDERSVREGLRNIIEWQECGFSSVETAENGQEALKVIEQMPVDLLITDLKMPVVDGITLIKTLSERNINIAKIILSGYQDFDSARMALKYGVEDYLLKPIDPDELTGCLSVVKRRLDEQNNPTAGAEQSIRNGQNAVFNLVHGGYSPETSKACLEEYGIDAADELYCVALVQIHVPEQIDPMGADDFIDSVHDILNSELKAVDGCIKYDESVEVVGLLFSGKGRGFNIQYIESVLTGIYNKIYIELNVSPYITFGGIVTKPQDIENSWHQAEKTREHELFFIDKKVVKYNDDASADNVKWSYSWDSMPLIEAIESGNVGAIPEITNRLSRDIIRNSYSRKIIRAALYGIMFDISNLLKRYNGNLSDLINYSIISDFIEHGDYHDISNWLSLFCIDIAEYMEKLQKSLTTGVIYQVQQYIHNNYASEITLQSIAAKFYINSSYLGRLYKKTFGESFNEYLNKYRISMVKKMLDTHRYRINEIIERAGYSHPEYFYRQFKRHEGISFVEYRKRTK